MGIMRSKKQVFSWLVVGTYLLFVAIMYLSFSLNYEPNLEGHILIFLVLVINFILTLWVTRNHLTAVTISFAIVLFSVSWILFTFNRFWPRILLFSHSVFISLFPAIFLLFFLYFICEKPFLLNKSKVYLSILFFNGLIEESVFGYVLDISLPIFFFFLGIIFLIIFCQLIYLEAKKRKMLRWSSTEIKHLLLATILGIMPFILFSILPSLITDNSLMDHPWTISFVLIIPYYMGHLISKHNLIVHRYWKLTFLTSSLIALIGLILVLGILYLIVHPSLIQLIVISHFFLFIGFLIQIVIILYTNHRRRVIEEQMNVFREEQEILTYYQMKNALIKHNFKLGSKYWMEKWNINNTVLYRNGEDGLIVLVSEAKEDAPDTDNDQNTYEKIIIQQNSLPYVVGLYRSYSFTSFEIQQMTSELIIWIESLMKQEQLLNLKNKMEDRIYTTVEKFSYYREMKLIDHYHNMISQYLHDDIQQYIYYIRQLIFSEDSLKKIRIQMDAITSDMEQSIQLRTIEWMGYPENGKEIDRLVYELSIVLEDYLSSKITLDMDVEVENFEKASKETKNLLYRIIKECMVNTYKHAEANNIFISLKKMEKRWILIVEDDGKGWEGDLSSSTRFGLASLYRQIEIAGGDIDITSSKNNGFKVFVYLPELEELK